MKLKSLYVSSFLGAAAVDLQLEQHPIHLFAGSNGAGKSSVRDAVALALTADLGRVSQKKDAAQLIHAGADGACCEVVDVDGDTYNVTISGAGKITDSMKGREACTMLPYVLDAQRFARLDTTERRAFLYGLMGVKTGQDEIAKRLKDKGADDAKVERVLPLLRAGFDAACKQAKSNATEAKGAWRTVTGETYGSEKAKTWRAPVPGYDEAKEKAVTTQLKHADEALGAWQQQIGKLQAEDQRREGLRTKLPGLHERAEKIDRITAKLATDEQELAGWEEDLKKTRTAAGAGPRVGLVHDLAAGLHWFLIYDYSKEYEDNPAVVAARAAIGAYEAEHGQLGTTAGDDKARARLPNVQKSRDLLASAVANDKRDLEAAQQSRTSADAIEAELAEAFDDKALAEARKQVDMLTVERLGLVQQIDAFKVAANEAAASVRKTKEAAQHAADVAAWDVIGDALSPDGIPAEILAEALGPINERLAQSAADTNWAAVAIGSDMHITAGGRAYGLLSESEKWRADAMLAEAIASLSGVRLLVLDRFDVLDLHGRNDLLMWLHTLAELGEIDTALLFGTLKATPGSLPATMAAHWIENGVVAQMKEAA